MDSKWTRHGQNSAWLHTHFWGGSLLRIRSYEDMMGAKQTSSGSCLQQIKFISGSTSRLFIGSLECQGGSSSTRQKLIIQNAAHFFLGRPNVVEPHPFFFPSSCARLHVQKPVPRSPRPQRSSSAWSEENTAGKLVAALKIHAYRISRLLVSFGDQGDALCSVLAPRAE